MGKWLFELHAPDGRMWRYDRETDARRHRDEFNRYIPRGGKLAVIVTVPSYSQPKKG